MKTLSKTITPSIQPRRFNSRVYGAQPSNASTDESFYSKKRKKKEAQNLFLVQLNKFFFYLL